MFLFQRKVKPNFIIVGFAKSGTSSIFSLICRHPDVQSSLNSKEPKFFNMHYDKGLNWYFDLFRHAKGAKAIGEATQGYTLGRYPDENDNVPRRIYEAIPKSKILFIARNPLERIESNYRVP